MKKIYKHLLSLAIISAFAVPLVAFGQADFGLENVESGLNNSLASGDPREIVGRIIQVALSFLGVIAVVIILYGGFKWMTAAGNEDKTAEAKKLLGAGVIGLVIILASWALATFLLNTLSEQISAT
ncbi:MAG: pilin [Patescibacteria group bacterium]